VDAWYNLFAGGGIMRHPIDYETDKRMAEREPTDWGMVVLTGTVLFVLTALFVLLWDTF
jgi:hypothetical protein